MSPATACPESHARREITIPFEEQGHRPGVLALSLDLRSGLAAEEAERRALEGHRAGDLGARVAAFYLADLVDRNLHQKRGFASLAQYAKQRMRMGHSTLKEYVRVGRALQELPELDRLFEEDELRWSQVRSLTRVVTPETERAWGKWAATRTVEEVASKTLRHQKGDLPTDSERRRIHTTKLAVQARLNPVEESVWSLWRTAMEERLFDGPVSDKDLLMWIAHKGVRELMGEPLTLRPANPGLDPLNQGRPVPYEERDTPTGKALRKIVLERDGWKCVCCGSTRNLSAHHIHYRRFGGPTVLANLVTLCEDCHSLVHDQFLILQGEVESLAFLDSQGQNLGERKPAMKHVLRKAEPAEATRGASAEATRGASAEATRGASTEATRGASTEATRGASTEATRGASAAVRVSFNDVPREVDASWWRRHRHLFDYSKRAGSLNFEPGIAPAADTCPLALDSSPVSESFAESDSGLDALVGQERVRKSLRVSVRSATKAGEPLGHLLLLGAPGLGKTSMARAVASELGGDLHSVMAPVIRDPVVLVRQLTSLRPGDVLFLDEVHRLSARVSEVLYEALEGGHVDLPVRCGMEQRSLRIRLAPFTLIAATTEEGMLPEPLRSRFVYQERLEFYGQQVLGEILERAAVAKGLTLTSDARDEVAAASRDTPREGLALLQAVCDEARAADSSHVDADVVSAAFERTRTAATGVTASETDYLRVLTDCPGPVGLSTLAARLGTSRRNVQRVFEPFLLRRGMLRLTARGRCLTHKGRLALATRPAACSVSQLPRSA